MSLKISISFNGQHFANRIGCTFYREDISPMQYFFYFAHIAQLDAENFFKQP